MTIRYLVALVLTVLLLAMARRTSTRHAAEYSGDFQGVQLSHHSVTENFGDGPLLIVRTQTSANLNAVVFFSEKHGGPYQGLEMSVSADGFMARLPALERGKKWFYHIEVSKEGSRLATFPADGDQFIRFKGHVSPVILVLHIFCMFAIIFLGVMAVFTSIDVAHGKGSVKRSVLYLLWTMIFAFIGGFPLGIAVAYQSFGQGWGGIPIGWDITDNKTLILFLFWLVTFLLSIRGLRGEKMAISNKTYAFLVTISFVVTFVTFLIPHSI